MANLTITLDDEDKKGIAEFCDQVGMTISGLYNVFTKQVLREGRIPFEIAVDRREMPAPCCILCLYQFIHDLLTR